tara:strand:+ start:20994 stop:21629 length:636 start_codon:yes stop_codon:yes gene_type:complete
VHYRSITAKILIDIKAVNFKPDDPYTLTSGRKSPVYVDCRKIISFTNERNTILQFAEDYISENKLDFDIIAGGETAGIPYAAFLSERLKKPMIYVRKKPKGFGKKSQIEGQFKENQKCILIEDLATDGASKISFIKAMRDNNLSITDTFVIFYYDTFNSSKTELEKLGIKIHCLCNWNDILEIVKKEKMLLNSEILKIEKFLFDNDEKDYE